MTSTDHRSTSPGEAAVSLQGVTKRFAPEVLGLDDVSVDFRAGEVTVLLGLSGSGKSTLLRHVNGLHRPTSGTVTVLGEEVSALNGPALRRLRRRIGIIFQHFHLVGSMSVLENVCSGRLGYLRFPRLGLFSYPRTLRREALEQLDRVGLADRAFQRADTLSGGQQQRVAIARALIQQPEVLLADEPVASLDPVSSQQVVDLVARIAREDDLTVICSLHQVETALGFGTRIIGLNQGRVVLDEPTATLSHSDALRIYSSVATADVAEPTAAPAHARQRLTASAQPAG